MMQAASPAEFMSRVMPWPGPQGPGWVNLHWVKDKKWRGRPFKEVGEFINMAQWLALKTSVADDIYYCMTVQAQTGKAYNGKSSAARSADNATMVKALWLDVDIKDPPKGYGSITEALDAIGLFVKDASLPNPSAFVLSGGGIHVYWIFDHALTIEEWRPYAEGLKAEAIRLGLRCDHGVTADPARVLRVPGTFNRKQPQNPRAVKVAALGADCTTQELSGLAALGATKLAAIVTAPVINAKTTSYDLTRFARQMPAAFQVLNAQADNLSDGINLKNDLPLNPDEIILHCGHFRDAVTTHGKDHGQGLWNLTMLAATWLDDGRVWAHYMSKGYPTYDPGETDKMFDRKLLERARGLGWPSCTAIESEGCKACKVCPLRGKIKSPLNMAERVPGPPEFAAGAQTPAAPEELHLPPGYTVNDQGVVCYIDQQENRDRGTFTTELKPLFWGKVAQPFTHDGRETKLSFTYINGPHSNVISIPYENLGMDMTLNKCLSKQTCMTRNEKYTREFMKSWVSQIDAAYKRQVSAPFGWIVDGMTRRGFAYGGKLFKSTGLTEPVGHPDRELQAYYTPTGEEKPIQRLFDIVSDRKNPALETILLQAFASPLLFVTGQKSAITWAWSNDSGAGKSTSLLAGMAVWSSPGKTKGTAMSTIVGLQLKLSQLQNLPLYIDEIAEREEVAKLKPQVRFATEGIGGTKGRRNLTLAETPTWQAIVACGANQSMRESMASSGTDAGAMRVFEFFVDKHDSTHDGREVDLLVNALDTNYGHIGLRYAKYLTENVEYLQNRAETLDKEIIEAVSPYHSEERFWKCTVLVTLLAGEVANHLLGREIIHLPALRAFLLETYLENREWCLNNVRKGNTMGQAEDIMGQFLDATINNQLWTPDMYKGRGAPKMLTIYHMPPQNTGKGNPVHVHWCVDDRLVQIAYPALWDFIDNKYKGFAATGAIKNITKHYAGSIKRRVNMLAGVNAISKLECDVVEIPIPAGSVFEPMLMSKVPPP